MTAIRKIVLYSTNGVATPVQHAMLHALATPESRDRLPAARSIASAAICWSAGLNEVGLECDPPAGAFYAFPNVEKIHKNSRTAAQILLEKAHIATIPGSSSARRGRAICASDMPSPCGRSRTASRPCKDSSPDCNSR